MYDFIELIYIYFTFFVLNGFLLEIIAVAHTKFLKYEQEKICSRFSLFLALSIIPGINILVSLFLIYEIIRIKKEEIGCN